MRAATYARLSDDGLSIPDQQAQCRKYAEDRGWQVVGEFKDVSKSAYKQVERKGFDAMLAAAASGQIDVIVVRHHDRLTRNLRDLFRLTEVCDEQGVAIHEYTGGEVDEFRGDINTVLAKRESKIKSQRIRDAVVRNVKAGKRTGGGPRPFGYDLETVEAGPLLLVLDENGEQRQRQRHRIISETINEAEAELVREAASRVLSGDSLRGIAKDWNVRGLTTTLGKPWYPKALQTILKSARIAGWREHKGELITEATWPAIIDLDTHKQLVAVLADEQRRTQRGTARKHLLPGFLYCGKPGCESRMYHHPGASGARSRAKSYICIKSAHLRIDAATTDAIIIEAVLSRVESKDLEEALSASDDTNERVRALVQERTRSTRRLTQTRKDWADGLIDRADWLAIKKRIEVRSEQIQREIDTLKSGSALKNFGDLSQVRRAWESWGLDQRRALLNAVIDKITVAPHPKGVPTHPMRADVIASRLDPQWLA
jgi:DNA invertase Pin-like site-specific DNA recombinase